jgi:uncharacterized protein YdhG (YjbR/CyaY superfamily)
MTSPVDDYLAAVPEPGRSTLQRLRDRLHVLLPSAEEGISYGAPAFKMNGKAIAGFAASKGHLTYFPHSGSVLATMPEALTGYTYAKGSLRFGLTDDLPDDLLAALVEARKAELGLSPEH